MSASRLKPLTVAQFCEVMQISRSTFYEWVAKGVAPKCRKLPNGQLRIDVKDFDTWYEARPVAA